MAIALVTTESCLEEGAILALARGEANEAALAHAQRHCDSCDDCRLLLAEVTRLNSERAAVTVPPHNVRAFQNGATLADRYRVVRWLGRGGMGEVYEVEDLVLGERAALKSLALEAFFDPGAITRLRRETSLARKVTHPNVCRVFDLIFHDDGHDDGAAGGPQGRTIPLLTMEMLDGCTLSAHLRKTGGLPVIEATRCAAQVAAGLDAAHAAGVLHRDLKSDNIMLVGSRAGGRAVITDFGLACAESAGTGEIRSRVSHPGGTAGYIAPERLAGQAATTASDVYSFGVVLHEIATGRLPALGSARAQPTLPPGWQAVIERCLAHDPAARFASAGAAVAALETRSTRRRRLLGALLAALALLLVAAVAIAERPGETPPAPAAARSRPAAGIVVEPLPPRPAPVPVDSGVSMRTQLLRESAVRTRIRPGPSPKRARPAPTLRQRHEPRLPADDLIEPFL